MIDLRSDTVTRPSPVMLEKMMSAKVGDDVFGDDPTVAKLERYAADLLGKQDAVFVCSGTQSNLCGLMAHCERGDEYLVSSHAHTYMYEGGGAAVLGSIQPQPLEPNVDGTVNLEKFEKALKPIDNHFARTKLVCLENTTGGRSLPLDYMTAVSEFGRENGLGVHLDGARFFNGIVDANLAILDVASLFDSISICLSKGLGAPVGSVLVGSTEIIDKARRWKKVLGGGWRQAGLLAAAGLFALEHNRERLADDHRHAIQLAEGLDGIASVKDVSHRTNMAFATVPAGTAEDLRSALAEQGILIYVRGDVLRLVTHLDIAESDIATIVDGFKTFYE